MGPDVVLIRVFARPFAARAVRGLSNGSDRLIRPLQRPISLWSEKTLFMDWWMRW
jgi:hypothetical protein